MRIAITHPTCWPEVRRGSERVLHDMSHWLAARGHDVTVISSAPVPDVVHEQEGAVARVLLPRRDPAPYAGRWLTRFHAFGWDLRRLLRNGEFDAVHCLNYHDAAGALAARRAGAKFRLVFQCTGIPIRRYFRRIPLDGLLFRQVARGADAVLTLSHFASEALRQDYGVDGVLLPSPTATEPFEAVVGAPPTDPLILFCGDADEPRKGAVLLAQAFAALAARRPAARLVYSGRAGAATQAAIRTAMPGALHERVTFLGLGHVDDLPQLYANATVCVNPAIWEALGNVLIEALASGTPVVGCRHGGIPDIIDNPDIGSLFDPGPLGQAGTNVEGLADAILRSFLLAEDPATRARCRLQAKKFSWDVLGPSFEAVLGAGHPVGSIQREAARAG